MFSEAERLTYPESCKEVVPVKGTVTTAKTGLHGLMSLVVHLEAMLQNIQKHETSGKTW